MPLADHLARQRNRDAAERTLMAWIRTCLSLISFGFGLDKIVTAIRSQGSASFDPSGWGVRGISLAFVLTGVLAMVAATRQHRRVLRRLLRDDFTYRDEPSLATATALMLSLIGVAAIALLLLGGVLP
ncbi:MAG: YidH family protein [Cyanobium sp.]